MADSTIANLTDGVTADATDRLPVERSPFGAGTNRYITPTYIRTYIHGTYGTGVATALGVNVGSAGAFVTNGGALGTPSSGTLTNCTGLPVAGGGTGLASATAYAVLCGGTTSTGAFQSIVSVGTSGQVLTSNGAGALPTFQAAGAASAQATFPGGVPLSSALFPAAYNMALPTGDVDLYTVPTGKRVFYMGYSLRNDTGGSITHYGTVKIGATYYRLTTNATTNTGGNGAGLVGYVAEAGETIAINVATTANGVLSVYAVEFDDSSGFHSPKLTSVSTGDNTLYTVGSGKTAFLQSTSAVNVFVSLQSVQVGIANASGASRTYAMKFTPSGGSTYAVSATGQSVSNNARSNIAIPGLATMAAGDAVVINVSDGTATQFIWLNVLETG